VSPRLPNRQSEILSLPLLLFRNPLDETSPSLIEKPISPLSGNSLLFDKGYRALRNRGTLERNLAITTTTKTTAVIDVSEAFDITAARAAITIRNNQLVAALRNRRVILRPIALRPFLHHNGCHFLSPDFR
jgi:hypothetical protein